MVVNFCFTVPVNNYLFKVNNRNTGKKVWNIFKVDNKDTRRTSAVTGFCLDMKYGFSTIHQVWELCYADEVKDIISIFLWDLFLNYLECLRNYAFSYYKDWTFSSIIYWWTFYLIIYSSSQSFGNALRINMVENCQRRCCKTPINKSWPRVN